MVCSSTTFWSLVEYDQAPPTVGTANMYTITRHLEWTRRILAKPSSERMHASRLPDAGSTRLR
jgi:hypothetical protein